LASGGTSFSDWATPIDGSTVHHALEKSFLAILFAGFLLDSINGENISVSLDGGEEADKDGKDNEELSEFH